MAVRKAPVGFISRSYLRATNPATLTVEAEYVIAAFRICLKCVHVVSPGPPIAKTSELKIANIKVIKTPANIILRLFNAGKYLIIVALQIKLLFYTNYGGNILINKKHAT